MLFVLNYIYHKSCNAGTNMLCEDHEFIVNWTYQLICHIPRLNLTIDPRYDITFHKGGNDGGNNDIPDRLIVTKGD